MRGSLAEAYCASIDEMKALVEPLPLVPAMCIGFRRSNSEGFSYCQLCACLSALRAAHLIPNFMAPFNHLRNGLLVHATARLPYRIDNGEIGLQRVQRRDRSLRTSEEPDSIAFWTYRIVALLHRVGAVAPAGSVCDAQRA